MVETKIIIRTLTEKLESNAKDLTPEQYSVLADLGKLEDSKIIIYEPGIMRFDVRDIFIDCPVKLYPTGGGVIEATFVKFRNNNYQYLDVKYSTFLKYVNTIRRNMEEEATKMRNDANRQTELLENILEAIKSLKSDVPN